MTRYAIYFTPDPASPLWQFGTQAIGYCAASGEAVTLPDSPFHRRPDALDLTAEPRRYGFHGTLKAPFELAEGHVENQLLAAAHSFAAGRASFEIPAMAVRALSRFVALVPAQPCEPLAQLAASCVEVFEPFRAPLSATDLARRLKTPLTERQRGSLETWGYPYVFDDFRFHMTLSGPLPQDVLAEAETSLAGLYTPIAAPVRVDAVTLFIQPDRNAQFRILERVSFAA